MRIRNQDRAQARRGQFGNGQRAGAADDHVRPAQRFGHVGDERRDLGRHTRLAVGRARGIDELFTRLVAHGKYQGVAGVALQTRQRLRHGAVQARRAQAAAHHQQADGPSRPAESQRRRRQRGDISAHRIADDACM